MHRSNSLDESYYRGFYILPDSYSKLNKSWDIFIESDDSSSDILPENYITSQPSESLAVRFMDWINDTKEGTSYLIKFTLGEEMD